MHLLLRCPITCFAFTSALAFASSLALAFSSAVKSLFASRRCNFQLRHQLLVCRWLRALSVIGTSVVPSFLTCSAPMHLLLRCQFACFAASAGFCVFLSFGFSSAIRSRCSRQSLSLLSFQCVISKHFDRFVTLGD